MLAVSRFLIYPETSGSPDIFSLSGRLKQIGKKITCLSVNAEVIDDEPVVDKYITPQTIAIRLSKFLHTLVPYLRLISTDSDAHSD